jgi:hypothetical protein
MGQITKLLWRERKTTLENKKELDVIRADHKITTQCEEGIEGGGIPGHKGKSTKVLYRPGEGSKIFKNLALHDLWIVPNFRLWFRAITHYAIFGHSLVFS